MTASSTEIPMPVLPWEERYYPPLPDPPASEPREPTRLGPVALLEFRDSMHEDSVVYAATGAEIDLWLAQLDEAIDAGQIDPRPSWELQAENEAQRVAAIVLARLAPSIPPPVVGTETPADAARTAVRPDADAPDLLRARDVRMTSREWRGAIRRGELLASKIGREYKATRGDYEAYVAARRVAPSRPKSRTHRAEGDTASSAVDRALASGRLRAIPGGRKR